MRSRDFSPKQLAGQRATIVLAMGLVLLGSALVGCGGTNHPEPGSGSSSVAEPVAPTSDDSRSFDLVVVAEFPTATIPEMDVLVSWVNREMRQRASGHTPWQLGIRVAGSVPEVAGLLRSGQADFYLDSPHPVLLARHLVDCQPILRRWKYGKASYRSVVVVRADSDIRSLQDLVGRRVAFEDRYSSSSFFLPMTTLRAEGMEGVFLDSAAAPVPPDRTGLVFSGEDSTTIHWVLAGKVEAGAMNEWSLSQMPDADRQQLRVLSTTPEIPRHLLAVRGDLDPAVVAELRELLLSAHETEDGRAMLERFSSTTRFDEIPADFMADLDRRQEEIVALDSWVGSQLDLGGS